MEQLDAAQEAGISRVTLSRYENGRQRPPHDIVVRLQTLYRSRITRPGSSAPRPGSTAPNREGELPRQLRLMALDFEREALQKGADDAFMRYVRSSFADPDFVALFAGGPDESPMTAQEAIDDMKAHINELRAILKTRLERARQRSGKLAPELDE